MDKALLELCSNLKELKKLLNEKRKFEKKLSIKENDYVVKKIGEKPQLKKIKNIKEPVKPQKPQTDEIPPQSKIKTNCLLIATITLPVVVMFITIFMEANFFVCMMCVFAVFFIMLLISNKSQQNYNDKVAEHNAILKKYDNDLKTYQKKLNAYKKNQIENKNNEEYNQSYQTLLETYNSKVAIASSEYKADIKHIKDKVKEINENLNKYDNLINEKFYDDIDTIITIIEDGRSDSLKEALNIMISDKKQNELIIEQKERNKIEMRKQKLEERRLDEQQRHNYEIERETRRQTEENARRAREEKESRRRGAPNCWQCKNYPCGGEPEYCGSFIKKT